MSQTNVSKFLILLIFSGNIWSSKATSSKLKSTDGVKETQGKLNFGLSNTFETTLHKFNDPNKNSMNYTSFKTTLTSPKSLKSSFSLSFNKQLDNYRQESLNNAGLSFSGFSTQLSKRLTLSGSTGLTIPLSDAARKSQDLITTIRLTPSFSYKFNKDILKNLSINYSPSFYLSFHEYKVQATGKSNTRYSINNRLVLSYSLTSRLGFSLDNAYTRQWNYSGQPSDSFRFDQNLGYDLGSGLNISIGHSIGGSALAVNGYDSNVQFFDKNASTVYISFGLAY